ncbi:MAG: transglycosylase domain-containing protein, partial [Pseudomonadota bacterium]
MYHLFLWMFSLGFLGLIAGIGAFGFVINYYGKDLPDYEQLQEYEPNVMTRIYAADGELLAEYAQEKRVFMPIQKIPDVVKKAFLAAEDKNFYEHSGLDFYAIARAAVTNIRNKGSGRRLVGASTITQQVAKNFLLTNEVSYERKIKEAILATKLERALTKDQLLELYLNEIFLGFRAYGVAAASQIYFDKSLDELTIAEAAYLAALPKAPNNYHPIRKYDAAISRRNWVVGRMLDDGYIEQAQADIAREKPLEMAERNFAEDIQGDFFAEQVRRIVDSKYGRDSLYQGGLTVRSSLDPELQNIAVDSLRDGLMAYDKRHGWRGPIAKLQSMENWQDDLAKIATPKGKLKNWQLAVVTNITDEKAALGFADGSTAPLPLAGVEWARKCLQDCYALGAEITRVGQVLEKADVVLVEKIEDAFVLRQIPKVQGAILVLDPHTGRVLAMQGGWTHDSSFNRATQAKRQPGSAFKPFVYLTAFEKGFTPSTVVVDGPFSIRQDNGEIWSPKNYSNKFYGPSTLRLGLEKSRNLMTVRLANK